MSTKVITIDTNILKKNEITAAENRELFNKYKILAVNLLSSPGSGKTSLLVQTCKSYRDKLNLSVSVGDLQTEVDAQRIGETGVPVVQINTGTACHLDANMVQKSLNSLPLECTDILFIENVGNLVCPATFDIGEHLKIVLLSVAEGEEKPLKYPPIFQGAHCVCINKVDLLPYVDFDMQQCRDNLKRICPQAVVFEFSCKTGAGLSQWHGWLQRQWSVVYGDSC
jgi:hydrogenase nickel incorporation protein HypB